MIISDSDDSACTEECDGGVISWDPDTHGSYTDITVTVSDGSETDHTDTQVFTVSAYYEDCAGERNGGAVVDNCGTCDADASNDCKQDCAGDWGGVLVDDACGVCGGDDSSCKDCAGVANGSSERDGCGACVEGATPGGASDSCIQDCTGEWLDPLDDDLAEIKKYFEDIDGDGLGYCSDDINCE